MTDRTCRIVGCEKPVHGRGLCSTHHQRLLRSGDPDQGRLPARQGCNSQEICSRPHHAFGLCLVHYQRQFKRRGYLKWAYKMTVEEWQALFDSQARTCPVCLSDTPRGDSIWHVHHDHTCCPGPRSCGRCVIAILCGPCNIAMGGFRDNPEWLQRAARLSLEWQSREKVRTPP